MSAAADLLTPTGSQLLDRLRGLEVTPELAMRLAEELRGHYPADLIAAALTQQSLRTAAREKFSRADEMFFTRTGLEMASPELVARHSARRFAGLASVADLCCGIGGDLTALAEVAGRVIAVDADADALRFARQNVAAASAGAAGSAGFAGEAGFAGPEVEFVRADVLHLPPELLAGVAAVFIDPARRAGGHRLRAGDSQPPLDWCIGLADQVPLVCIKTAPGIPHELVPASWELEFVAVGRALKEALLWSPAFATTQRRATVLPGGDALVTSEGPAVPVTEPGNYLLDPSPAVTRAGLVQELARELGAWQIDPMIAFLSVDEPVSTPFARTMRIMASMPWHEKQAARKLRELGVGSADIRRRGLAGDVEQIRRRLGLQGDKSATIVLTRREDRPWGLICEEVAAPGQAQPAEPGDLR
jgi:SAM-dependent methyltransferase